MAEKDRSIAECQEMKKNKERSASSCCCHVVLAQLAQLAVGSFLKISKCHQDIGINAFAEVAFLIAF